jgi:hypothetical protein
VSVVNVNAAVEQDGPLEVEDAPVLAQLVQAVAKLSAVVTALQGALTVQGQVSVPFPATFPLPSSQVAALSPAAAPGDYPLPADQVDELRPPTEYPLPAAQAAALTPPSSFPLPAGQVSQLQPPSSFPLPSSQLAALEPQRDALTADELAALEPLQVEDQYAAVEHLEAQPGAAGVLVFTASAPGQLVWVDVDPTDPEDTKSYTGRATVDGTTPTATRGWAVRPGPNPIPVPMVGSAVKVWAPAGVAVSVQVVRRA